MASFSPWSNRLGPGDPKWKAVLWHFLKKHSPDQLRGLRGLMAIHKGREKELHQRLIEAYLGCTEAKTDELDWSQCRVCHG